MLTTPIANLNGVRIINILLTKASDSKTDDILDNFLSRFLINH